MCLISLFYKRRCLHLYFLIAGWELPLLKHKHVVSDPLQEHGDQFIILMPTQLQLLEHKHTPNVCSQCYLGDKIKS